jgi:hypothetical protein
MEQIPSLIFEIGFFIALIITLILSSLAVKIYKLRGQEGFLGSGKGDNDLNYLPILFFIRERDTEESKILIKRRNIWVIVLYTIVVILIVISVMDETV